MSKLLPVLVSKPPPLRYSPLLFVTAASDSLSPAKAADAAQQAGIPADRVQYHTVPRAREVKQSWVSTVRTTLRALAASFMLVWHLKPDLLLCNGPGAVAVPSC